MKKLLLLFLVSFSGQWVAEGQIPDFYVIDLSDGQATLSGYVILKQ